VSNQEDSHTLAPMRAPALADCDADDVGGNPLLWRLGRYRRRGRTVFSRLVLQHLLFGCAMAGVVLGLSGAMPAMFEANDFNFIASVAVGAHMLWLSMRTCFRMDAWLATSFFDELLLTAMSPREIASAIAQSVSRPIFASLVGTLAPICAAQAGAAVFGDPCAPHPSAFVFWGVLAPFVALSVFAAPWLVMWETMVGPVRALPVKLMLYAWPGALPISGFLGNVAVSAATAGVLAFALLNAALLLAPKVPALLADRERAPSGGKALRLSETSARRAGRV